MESWTKRPILLSAIKIDNNDIERLKKEPQISAVDVVIHISKLYDDLNIHKTRIKSNL